MLRSIPLSAVAIAGVLFLGGCPNTPPSGGDAGTPDSGAVMTPDSGAVMTPDSGAPDAGAPPDSGPSDSGPSDSGTPDSGPSDAGLPDSGPPDSGPFDAGFPDSGRPDSGLPDSGPSDSGLPDSGAPDSGSNCPAGDVVDGTTGMCRTPYTCSTLPTACNAQQHCVQGTTPPHTPAIDAMCVMNPCNLTCTDPGASGQCVLSEAGDPICETTSGYFYDPSGSASVLPCDADGDGWLTNAAYFALNSTDSVIQSNARCTLRTVDRVVLENSLGEIKTILLGQSLPLYESPRNDEQDLLDLQSPPSYGLGGRPLRATELNSLTKACIGSNNDSNDNSISDIQEWGRPPYGAVALSVTGDVRTELLRFYQVYAQYAYYLELHRGWYEPPTIMEVQPDGS
jgi:hypothetical protein